MSIREQFLGGFVVHLPQPKIPEQWSGHPLREAHLFTVAQLKTIQGWKTPVVCHCDEVVRDCFRCKVYFETCDVRRRVGAFLASQGLSPSFEEFIAVRDSARLHLHA
jgi:hypothetical protein